MTDIFGAAAARAQQKRDAERKKGETADTGLFYKILAEKRAEREAEEAEREKAQREWEARIRGVFDGIVPLANSAGRGVKAIEFNGEVAFVVRDGEAIRVYIGPIKDVRGLQYAVAKLTTAAMGC